MNLKNSCGCIPGYQARKGLHTGTVKIDPHKFCGLKYKICQNTKTLIFRQLKTQKLDTAVLAFFKQENLLAVCKMTSVRASYISKFVKHYYLADSSTDSFIKKNL